MMREKKIRSLAKGISWRIIATSTTFILAYVVFRDDELVLQKAGALAALEFILKLFVYYLHERAWLYVLWGVKNNKPA